jgi:hypothetical protein
MRWTTFRKIDPPVRARRDWLQPALGRRCYDDRDDILSFGIGSAWILGEAEGQAVTCQLHDIGTQGNRTLEDRARVRIRTRRPCDDQPSWSPSGSGSAS